MLRRNAGLRLNNSLHTHNVQSSIVDKITRPQTSLSLSDSCFLNVHSTEPYIGRITSYINRANNKNLVIKTHSTFVKKTVCPPCCTTPQHYYFVCSWCVLRCACRDFFRVLVDYAVAIYGERADSSIAGMNGAKNCLLVNRYVRFCVNYI